MRAKLSQAEVLLGFLPVISLVAMENHPAPVSSLETQGKQRTGMEGKALLLGQAVFSLGHSPSFPSNPQKFGALLCCLAAVPHRRMCLNSAKKDVVSFCKKQPPKVPLVGVFKSSVFAN